MAEFFDYLERLNSLIRSWQRDDQVLSQVPAIQLSALRYLSICNHYSDTLMGVTDYLGLTKGTVSQSLKVLEERKWLYREQDLQDKRIVHLQLTDEGKAISQRLSAADALKLALTQLGPEFSSHLTNGLHTLLSTLQKNEHRNSFGVCQSCRFHETQAARPFCGLTKQALPMAMIDRICREHQVNADECESLIGENKHGK
ncbi:MarR family transcriptional regulator [Shewanella sp. SNU WT4]|uniref:MarR family winged helix-turn-helix transcriptional regulator n=1 Tax=Shewanella sp. SNU WT4 TaxID=2590015 RepID=UPI0019802CDA|nr:MarR family transcriptional regulator [Shewanella sp. SNU WT4]